MFCITLTMVTHISVCHNQQFGNTISQQAMYFDRLPGHVRIDLLKYM